ncbi:MAG: GNAT family N-acetyltransferase [Chloroflexi bacterium]|nr:GNAT family N-acetyltransferase [Chloroflexota bacterium]
MMIREFNLERDYAAVARLWAHAGPGVSLGRTDTREELVKKVARDLDLFLVVEVAGEVVGTVIGGWDGRRGIIYHLAVDTAHRDQGIDTALMNEVEIRLVAKGCVRAWLVVTPDNFDVIPFYERLGWEKNPAQLMGKYLK